MNRRLSSACLALAALLLGSTAPLASQGISVGAAASYGEDSDFGVGPRISVALPGGDLGLSLVGSFDYFFPSVEEVGGADVDIEYWELNGNLILDIPLSGGTMAPYAGAGISYANGSGSVAAGGFSVSTSESEVGANLLAGLRVGSVGLSPFLEGRYSTASEQVVVAVGVMF